MTLNEREIKDKSVLVTGGASGIGAKIAELFLKEGAKYVFLADINETVGNQTVEEFNSKYETSETHFIKCDATSDEQLTEAFEKAISISGKLDVLVNNAGLMTEQKLLLMLDLNIKGTINASFKALEHMRSDNGGSGGTIINISSILGGMPLPLLPSYQASKAAVIMFSASLGNPENYMRTQVRVLNVAFGPTDTHLLQELETRGFDEATSKILGDYNPHKQSPDSAAAGVIEAFKSSDSGSTWCVADDKPAIDRTEMVEKGFALFFPMKVEF